MITQTPRKIFSIPLNPKLTQQEFAHFYGWLQIYKDWIYDIYFTSRIAPFKQDAMGDVFMIEENHFSLIENALNIQKYLGIQVSATFNNIQVAPTQENLDTFIVNFKKLYDAGIRAATIPHTHWMATGQIKAAFPELKVKNTILRNVTHAQEVVNLANYGFDYINLDRDLMRDMDQLVKIKRAKAYIKETTGRDITISLLANEGCLGNCSMMDEHFHYNNTRNAKAPQYFNDPISRVSCPKWEVEDSSVPLKTANLSPWKADWDEYLDELGIDVFKMHGREDIPRMFDTMTYIERYVGGEEILAPGFMQWTDETGMTGKPIEIWRDKIKNCKFDCWECNYCDKIYERKSDLDYSPLVKHVVDAIAKSGVPKVYLDIPGLTSPRVQTLLNHVASGVGSYLEIGSYLGATASAALKDNALNATFIDTWEENVQDKNNKLNLPPNSREEFENNITPYVGSNNVRIIQTDMFDVQTANMSGTVQMFFYDGPHDYKTTYDAITYYYSTLTDEAIIIVDDANWKETVDGTINAITDAGGRITYKKLILNSEENKTEWWNGLYVAVIRK